MMNFTTDLAVNGGFEKDFSIVIGPNGGMTSFHTNDKQMRNCLGVEHDHHRPEAATDGGCNLRGPSKIGFWMGFWGWIVCSQEKV